MIVHPKPKWLQPVATETAIFIAGVLIAGIIAVPLRSMRAPEGYDQPRAHLNTKNTTRFTGETMAEVAANVSRAVYPATTPGNSPSVILLYNPENWQAGLQAASFLRPLDAVLLPTGGNIAEEIQRLQPKGSDLLSGAQVVFWKALKTQHRDNRAAV